MPVKVCVHPLPCHPGSIKSRNDTYNPCQLCKPDPSRCPHLMLVTYGVCLNPGCGARLRIRRCNESKDKEEWHASVPNHNCPIKPAKRRRSSKEIKVIITAAQKQNFQPNAALENGLCKKAKAIIRKGQDHNNLIPIAVPEEVQVRFPEATISHVRRVIRTSDSKNNSCSNIINT